MPVLPRVNTSKLPKPSRHQSVEVHDLCLELGKSYTLLRTMLIAQLRDLNLPYAKEYDGSFGILYCGDDVVNCRSLEGSLYKI
jgi:hypothetical protein